MEAKINIVEILKDKPVGLKFYSNTFGYISFNGVHKDKVYFFSEDTNAHSVKPNGKMYDGGECIIFPSKEMRDWEKFSWKKGDVLVNSRGLKILFDRWANDNYTSFYAKTINLVEDGFLDTNLHTLASEKEAKSFIKCIEERFGGKLNLQTLEIQKQPEFKDGDIVLVESHMLGINTSSMIAIFRKEEEIGKYKFSPALCESNEHDTYLREDTVVLSPSDIKIFRPADDSEKQQLFDALAKKGKAWDAEKKQFVDLKPKVELKPFDKVLSRRCSEDYWVLNFYSHKTDYYHICIDGSSNLYCIPYNEETAHLLGTTDEWKGGEG